VTESPKTGKTFNFEKELEDLLRRKPVLSGFRMVKLSGVSAEHPIRDLRNIEAYIEESWAKTYRYKNGKPISRFYYSAGYLQWLLSSPPDAYEQINLIVDSSNEEVVGLAYGVPRKIRFIDSTFQTVIVTGLSVSPAYTGIGVAQLLNVLSKNEIFTQNGNNPYFIWWDDGLNLNGHSLEIFRRRDPTVEFIGKFPMLAKFFDCDIAFSVLALPFYEKPVIKMLSRKRPANTGLVKPMSATDAEKFYDILLKNPNGKKKLERRWALEGFIKEATFKNPYDRDRFTPMYFAFYKNADIVGGILGYRIPVRELNTADFMFSDHLFYKDGLSMAEKKGFIWSSEKIAIEQYGVFGSLYLGGFDNTDVFKSLYYMPTYPRIRSLVFGISSPSGLGCRLEPRDIFIDHH